MPILWKMFFFFFFALSASLIDRFEEKKNVFLLSDQSLSQPQIDKSYSERNNTSPRVFWPKIGNKINNMAPR